jgi:hypothetical protein
MMHAMSATRIEDFVLLMKCGFNPDIAELYCRRQNCSCLSGPPVLDNALLTPADDVLLCAQLRARTA